MSNNTAIKKTKSFGGVSASPFANLIPKSPLNAYLKKNFIKERKKPLLRRMSISTTYQVPVSATDTKTENLICKCDLTYGRLDQETGNIDITLRLKHDITANTCVEATYKGRITLDCYSHWSVDNVYLAADIEASSTHLLERVEDRQDKQAHNIRNYAARLDAKTGKYVSSHVERQYTGKTMLLWLRREAVNRLTAASKAAQRKTEA